MSQLSQIPTRVNRGVRNNRIYRQILALFLRKTAARARKKAATALRPRPASCKAMFAELSNYLDEQLDESMCEKLERHLDGCEPCKVFLASLESAIERLRYLPPESLNREGASQLRRELLAKFPSF